MDQENYGKYRHWKIQKNSHMVPVVSMDENHNGFNDYYSGDIISRIGEKELMQMIHELPPGCKMVFNLFVFEGLKHREIAEKLNISKGTSKSNLSDARALLKKKINTTLKPIRKNTYL